ncbi:outer membrane protein-like protein iml2 [Tricladium varicosporioides]|nr:outer membrane protein-like protein iml2 [Hymenoscyphus varicosporioides]
MASWFRSATKSSAPMTAVEEDKHLQEVEHALLQLLNDDIAEADRILKRHQSSYHHLGRGISSFIGSMLGVEKEMLREAAQTLQTAENKTWEDMKKAQKEPEAFRSHIYPPGTEYLLCYAVCQLTSAICAVMSGSVTEAIRGFYKLRKAFLTLDGIMAIEQKYLKERVGSSSSIGSRSRRPSTAHSHSTKHSHVRVSQEVNRASEKHPDPAQPPAKISGGFEHVDVDGEAANLQLQTATNVQSRLLEIDPADVGITSHTDIFIHSGVRLCYGILLVVFSMIENPLFSKILYIVGFKGDRERGTRYLWEAARFDNFNSAIAGISLLGYYNGLVGFCDILPTDSGADDDLSGYPRARCVALLADMRKRYPESKLWKMEEARMHAYNRDLRQAATMLSANADSNMKQIATINMFELSLTSLFLHDYELSVKSWQTCLELSNWSPAMYLYLTGCSYLEMYRDLRVKDPKSAEVYKKKATEFIRKAPSEAGKQKVMSKELPFDSYIVRKISKWEERTKAWGVDLVDAVGISPLTEMIYFWGGTKKENKELLERSLFCIGWERSTCVERLENDLDEVAIQKVLGACFMRHLGRLDEAEGLCGDILKHDKQEFKGHLKDDWTLPSANYEMACLAWVKKDLPGPPPSTSSRPSTSQSKISTHLIDYHKVKVLECESWLEKTQKWDQYILDTRVSVKVVTSLNTVKRHKKLMGY